MTRSCLLQLGLWAALGAGMYLYLRSVHDAGVATIVISAFVGLLVAMASLLFHGVFRSARERSTLSAASSGRPPADGEWLAVSGAIRSSSPVRAPLSGQHVVAYTYSITREERMGTRGPSLVEWFSGKALSSSAIATPHGSVRLLVVPNFEIDAEPLETSRAVSNANAYIRSTTFEPRETAKQRTDALEREWADDDGVFRIDKRFFGAEVDMADGFRFEERVVKQGEQVCAFGVYSQERRGIVLDEKWGSRPRLTRGTAEETANALRSRMIRYTVGTCVLLGGAVLSAVLYVRSDP